MNFLTWTFAIIGIGVSFIPLLFSLFQYFNKRGSPKTRVVKKSFTWGLTTLFILYMLGLVFWVHYENDFTKQFLINAEIVLDCSTSMREPFSGRTKLDIAKNVIQKILSQEVAESDNLAFRQYGGPCEGKNNRLIVKFGTNNEKQIQESLKNLKTRGKATLVDAIVEATGDFNDVEQFRGVNKTIIAIVGSGDSCVPNPEESIRKRFEEREKKR